MAFQLTSMSRIFVFPDKPETVDTVAFVTGTIFLETGEKFGTSPDDWVKVQLSNSAVQGWLKSSSGTTIPDPVRPDLDVEGFVRSALIAEQAFNQDRATAPNFVFADYVLALAFVESNMTNLGGAETGPVGPLQITTAEWQDFVTNGGAFSDAFAGRDGPSAQAYYACYRMRADGRAIVAARPAGGDAPKIALLDIFHAHLTSRTVALAIQGATAADGNKPPAEFNAAFTAGLLNDVFGKLQRFVPGSALPTTLDQFVTLTGATLDAALKKAFALIQQFAPDQVAPTTGQSESGSTADQPPAQGGGSTPASGLNYAAAGVAVKRRPFGDMIVARFASAGYGKNQQVAAVANAIRESDLDPNAASTPPEMSFGLFQCNVHGGLGNGFTQAQLCNPETNIAIIIKEARRHTDFAAANTLETAVEAFVRDIERPANPIAQIQLRLKTAQKLVS